VPRSPPSPPPLPVSAPSAPAVSVSAGPPASLVRGGAAGDLLAAVGFAAGTEALALLEGALAEGALAEGVLAEGVLAEGALVEAVGVVFAWPACFGCFDGRPVCSRRSWTISSGTRPSTLASSTMTVLPDFSACFASTFCETQSGSSPLGCAADFSGRLSTDFSGIADAEASAPSPGASRSGGSPGAASSCEAPPFADPDCADGSGPTLLVDAVFLSDPDCTDDPGPASSLSDPR
jgi:hypothetical protein